MLEILSARNTQSTVSGIHYRKYLHQWICLPDMQVYVQARKVNEQLIDVSNCPQLDILCLLLHSLSSYRLIKGTVTFLHLVSYIIYDTMPSYLTCIFYQGNNTECCVS